ncbi:MAG TPA: hypothetical protein VK254_04580, partial [Candidatus Bathyarchaeia archaeon]|nr:hypothetical protein [Candidatus Bathyarchaeia archaeon]
MAEKKNTKKISDILFGKAGEVFTNIRLFLWGKKIAKVDRAEQAKIAETRARLGELFGGEIGSVNSVKNNSDIDASESDENLPVTQAAEETAEPAKMNLPAIITGFSASEEPAFASADAEAEADEKEMVFIKLSEIAKRSTYSKNY